MNIIENEYIWAEKYRPTIIQDLILPSMLKLKIKEWINDKDIPNIALFSNTPGTGKTSLNKILLKELDADSMFINSSLESGIGVVRNKIITFSSQVSLFGKLKIISLSECDYTTSEFQASIRDIIESYSDNVRFILTANYPDRIIEPVLARMTIIDFDKEFEEHKQEVAVEIFNRLIAILDNENVKYNKEDLTLIIKNYFPSIRQMLIVLQQMVVVKDSKKVLIIDKNMLESSNNFDKLIESLKSDNFVECRKLIGSIVNINGFYQYLYKNIDKIFELESIPSAVITIQHYYYQSQLCRDKDLCLTAMVCQLLKSKLTYK